MTKEILLTKEYKAIVDDDDYEILSKFKWSARESGRRVYASRHPGRTMHMHREILGAPKDMDVDHIDGNGLNNQRSNLRLATRSQNMGNSKKHVDNSSGAKGVTWSRDKKKWEARIRCGHRRMHIGYFANIEDAAHAYDAKARELFGEFARLNNS